MLNFCTLFDKNYIPQGLTMYKSLKKTCGKEFHLFIFALCDTCYDVLKKLNLENVTLISLAELEKGIPALLEAKKNRTQGEYCWTCESATILYCLQNFKIDQCTYIDSDLYFYSNPKVLLDEMADKSVLITEHRFTPKYDQTETAGKYCVQFTSFKNNENGMKVLKWWVNECLKWCYNRVEDGKFGDQKYLDDWPQRFDGVHELQHLGGGVAPWNVQQYSVIKENGKLFIAKDNKKYPLVFYHFHNLKIDESGYFSYPKYSAYEISKNVEELIYKPYMKKMSKISMALHKENDLIPSVKNKFSNIIPFKQKWKSFRKQLIRIKFGKETYVMVCGRRII